MSEIQPEDLNVDRVSNLETQLSAAQDKVIELESSIDDLKNKIKQALEIGPNDDIQFKGWEVMNVLSKWACGR